jgi:hypothetical protein
MASTELQLYTAESKDYYSQDQLRELNKKLDPRFISKRKGGGNRTLSYIEGHDAIDNANRIFGFGNWGYRPLSLEQVVLLDPMTGEPVGIEYKALVELTVRGAIAPIVDVGSQPVATWTVDDQIMQRRLKAAQNSRSAVDESEFTPIEKREARAVIVEAHEQAKKGAVTDALKRALRAFGEQFGNGLYGDGRVDMSISEESTVESRPAARQNGNAPRTLPAAQPAAQPPYRAIYDDGVKRGAWTRETFYATASGILDGFPVNANNVKALSQEQLGKLQRDVERYQVVEKAS